MSLVVDIRIDPAGLQKLYDAVGKLGSKAILSAASRESGLYIQRQIILKTPVRTGAARGSVNLKSATASGAIVAGTLNYMPGLEEGTKPHIIVPRRAKVLAFKGGSGTVFTKRVKHPGTKGRHMFRDGLMQSKAAVEGIIAKHIRGAS